jgi:hypothetical protein
MWRGEARERNEGANALDEWACGTKPRGGWEWGVGAGWRWSWVWVCGIDNKLTGGCRMYPSSHGPC